MGNSGSVHASSDMGLSWEQAVQKEECSKLNLAVKVWNIPQGLDDFFLPVRIKSTCVNANWASSDMQTSNTTYRKENIISYTHATRNSKKYHGFS